MSNDDYANFSLDKPRYDQNTYVGRYRHFSEITRMGSLFAKEEKIQEKLQLLEDFRNKTLPVRSVTGAELWEARLLKESVFHPDTGERVPKPFRMSAFTLANIPIVLGMLTAGSGIGPSIFWQWVNQTYNAAVNHYNGPKSGKEGENSINAQLTKAYVAAVGTSSALVIGFNQLLKRATRLPPVVGKSLGAVVPYIAVASAGAVNARLMKQESLDEGIVVKSADGEVLGESRVAAQTACDQVMATRIVLPAPILVLPPLIMARITKSFPSLAKRGPGNIAVQLAVIAGCLTVALPGAIALFPQTASLPVEKTETEIQQRAAELSKESGVPITEVFFNRGL